MIIWNHCQVEMRERIRKEFAMKRFALAAIVLALALSSGMKWTSAQPAAQVGSELLPLLPDGSGVVIVDVQKITSSSLWSTISAQSKIKSSLDKAQNDIGKLGLKLEDLHTVAVVLPSSGFSNFTGVVTGSFNQSDLLSRLRADQKIKITSENYKGVDVYTATPSERTANTDVKHDDMVFAFYDSATVAFGNSAGVRASIDTRKGEKPGIAQNAKVGQAMSETLPAAIRFAFVVTPALANSVEASQLPLPDFSSINLIFGSIDVTTGLDLNATLRNDTAEHALAIANQLNGLLDMARGFLGASKDPKMAMFASALKTVTVTGVNNDVKIVGILPGELLAQVLQ